MGKNQTFIEINGQRYHAGSGKATNAAANPKTDPPPSKARQTAKHAARRQPASSHTLMRRAVKKPVQRPKSLKAVGHLDHLARPFLGQIEQRASISGLDAKRLQHAKRIKRSRAISRFPQIKAANRPAVSVSRPTKPVPQTVAAPAGPSTTAELLERAIQRAVSHEQPPVKPVRHGRIQGLLARSKKRRLVTSS